MSRTPEPSRFCPACGAPAVPAANFCTACGGALRGGAGRSTKAAGWREQMPALVVFGAFLAIGLGLWISVLAPGDAPERMPLAKQQPPTAPSGGDGGELPADHPPLALPADVTKFIADLEKQAEASPNDLATWKRLGDVEYRAAQIDKSHLPKAEQAFRKVLALAPNDLDAIRGLGNVHFDRDEYPQAIEQYARYLEIDPKDSSVRTDLGTMHLYEGDAKKALAEYDKVLAADPKFFQAHFNKGIAYRRAGEEENAKKSFEQARALAPDERTKQQIAAALGEGAATSAPGAAAPQGSFQGMVERTLREHPIAGPKVVGFEWPAPTSGKVLLEAFPMEAMPQPIRERFLARLEKELADARAKAGGAGAVELALVDRASGKVMATVVAR
jgi:tetratricopeptide (TPR) repeat protein